MHEAWDPAARLCAADFSLHEGRLLGKLAAQQAQGQGQGICIVGQMWVCGLHGPSQVLALLLPRALAPLLAIHDGSLAALRQRNHHHCWRQ